MASATQKLKVLCLHGYRQNAKGFREKTGAFRKIPAVKKYLDLVFITAPNRVPKLPTEADEAVDTDTTVFITAPNRVPKLPTEADEAVDTDTTDAETGWWFSGADRTYMAQDFTDCCNGFKESIELVEETFKEQGPFHGIISFSQGASFASLLCGMQEQNPDSLIKFNFVVLVAGFKSRQSSHQFLYSHQITIPSLHVFGDTDKVIPKEMSEALLQHFTNPTVLPHPGGHFIPAAGPQKQAYTEFIQSMMDKKIETS